MPLLILSKVKDNLDSSMKKKVYAFFEKLQEDDTLPGLHIEPIKGSVDPRVRTGRVDDNYRCVMFKLVGDDEPAYVIHGTWKHDVANRIAEKVRLQINPVTGVPEIERVLDAIKAEAEVAPAPATPASAMPTPPLPASDAPPSSGAVEPEQPADPTADAELPPSKSPSWSAGLTADAIHSELGIDLDRAEAALGAKTEDELLEMAAAAPVEWHGEALLELATGTPLSDVTKAYGIGAEFATVNVDVDDDAKVLTALREHPAAKASFHWIDDNEELRRIVEAGDLVAWRLFLHPEQQRYVDGTYNGPFRLAGGAGTGKTVVALHRTRRLAKTEPDSRVLLTTFTRNLADDLAAGLRQLDDTVTVQSQIGKPGVLVKGVDQVVWAVLQAAGSDITEASAAVLGDGRAPLAGITKDTLWKEAIDDSGADLPASLSTTAFFQAEYGLVVLPNRITTPTGYVRVRRQGRGVALDRAKRLEVWKVIDRYRALARAADSTDYQERAEIAAAWLAITKRTFLDHVVVDEAQDLNLSQLRFLRAVVSPGPDDMFICEDSHQRIYGQKIVLSKVDIQVRGRSRRLKLNYRTTAQNLDWAMHILAGGQFTDLDGVDEEHSYYSARSGPKPKLLPTSSMSSELDQAADLIKSWVPDADDPTGRASRPEAIAVLVRDRYRRQTVVSGLAERGIDARAVDAENAKPGMPLVMTMHRGKGLEFTHVLLFGVHEGSVPNALADYKSSEEDFADAMLRERSLLYVAATRARDVLAVSWSGEKSSLIADKTSEPHRTGTK